MNQNLTTISTTAVHIAAIADTINGDEDQTLAADFSFDPTDPLAVTMVLDTAAGPVPWTFARDLLIDGEYEPVGDGDVHVWPCLSPTGEAVVIIELASPAGETLLQFPTRSVHDFIRATLDQVPAGTENIDVDTWLTELLGDNA